MDKVIYEVADRGIPFWGSVWGFSSFFESSEESPGVKGLGLLPGKILRIPRRGTEDPPYGLEFPDCQK